MLVSAWQVVTPLLKAKGHKVIEVNLTGHVTDSISFANVTFQSYVDTVKAAIDDRKYVVLGHF